MSGTLDNHTRTSGTAPTSLHLSDSVAARDTMAAPTLPAIPPISPLPPPSPSSSFSGLHRPSSALAAIAYASPSGSLTTDRSYQRPLAHSLTVHIPAPLTPSPSDTDLPPSPVFKNPPGIARRRTVIQSTTTHEPSPVNVSDSTTPPRVASPEPIEDKPSSVERGSILMPEPQPTPALEQKPNSPRRLEKKRASADLKNSSPSSPTARRSLPRPPKMESHVEPTSSSVPVRTQSQSQPSPPPSSSWPPLNVLRTEPPASSQPMQLPAQHQQVPPTFYHKHQQNKSASSLPVIPGISDAGPYPSSNSIRQPQGPPKPQVQQPKPNLGLGRPTAPPNGAGSSRNLQEEVCLECMMRDRDLADVDVQGEDVWDRESDAGFIELVRREEGLLRSMGSLDSAETSAAHGKFRSVIDMDDTSSSDECSQNAGSDGPETRRHREEERHRKQAVKARHKEADWRVSKEVGWRGFSWEEGQGGEGLPAGFRGGKGGPLTEEGIKSIMAKFPSASAHRYQKLQDFLRNQWLLVLEIRAEAQRLGHFAFPDDLSCDSSLSSHEARFPTGATSSASYSYRRPLLPEQTGGLRQSPSSPANLLASPVAPIATSRSNPQRPMTQYLPRREPAREFRTPRGYDSSSVGKRGHSKNTSSTSALEPLTINTNVKGTGDDGRRIDDDDLWTPDQPQGLRPFSFAVRAGAAAAREGSEGHGSVRDGSGQRKSLWGRWGGSVTSFFGGSQGGSGSMVDMHLGLDNERRSRAISQVYPRAISLASPTRPSFFSRDSRGSSVLDHEPRMSRVISQSRLSQVHTGGEGDMEDDGKAEKKKGIKGFFKKMKPKGSRKNSKAESPNLSNYRQSSSTQEYNPRPSASSVPSAPETPLALPPPISVLVRGGDRGHARTGSGSSSSMLTDGQESVSNRLSGSHLYGSRSVSAPFGSTSTSDVSMGQSASPGSSKFATTTSAAKRESYASGGNRRSTTIGEMGEDRRSVVEILSNANGANGDRLMCDEPMPVRPCAARPHNKTSTSLSASSQTMLETPPPINYSNANAFFNHQQHIRSSSIDTGGSLSPNRYKNLPPLPPPGSNDNLHIVHPKGSTASPDSFSAVFPDQELSQNKASFYSYPQPQPVAQPSYRQYPQRFHQQQHFQPTVSYAPGYGYGGRASLDQRGSRPRVEKQRAVQTMYGHPMMGMDGMNGMGGTAEVGEVEKKKKGLKSFFGVNKAGRMA